jgi:hypothetical protein
MYPTRIKRKKEDKKMSAGDFVKSHKEMKLAEEGEKIERD